MAEQQLDLGLFRINRIYRMWISPLVTTLASFSAFQLSSWSGQVWSWEQGQRMRCSTTEDKLDITKKPTQLWAPQQQRSMRSAGWCKLRTRRWKKNRFTAACQPTRSFAAWGVKKGRKNPHCLQEMTHTVHNGSLSAVCTHSTLFFPPHFHQHHNGHHTLHCPLNAGISAKN